MSIHILLLRHGTTQWNREKRYLGHTDIPLLPAAQQELEPVRQALSAWQWDNVYCSDLVRCRESLDYVMTGSAQSVPKASYDPALRELDFGQWEGCTYSDLCNQLAYRRWIDDPASICPPGGESWQHFSSRVNHFAGTLIPESQRTAAGVSTSSPDTSPSTAIRSGTASSALSSEQKSKETKRILIMTHGGVIRQLITLWCPAIQFWDIVIPPAGGYLLKWEEADCEAVPFPL
ncbi:histidine phosphatase family protein [Paenibacillus bovis]|uniref:Fructose-2,6-bisphosphatase n=1 Tax=Paenibacillus bovis TaxID=1616788 RepID=A0A172ZFC0_9BACL|nr:histidine phosphatase family protein [Paenibacillus bovis]ANF96072.1 hypothetical protein AR543_08730 [Paenibacillus bovis]